MNTAVKTRLRYVCGAIVLIVLGLLSRRTAVIPAGAGDALWAMTLYCCWRILLVRQKRSYSALAALITSYAVEFSQLLRPAWLVSLRSTFLGHMLLGQGFLWSDLLAYTIGTVLIFLLDQGTCLFLKNQ